MMIRNFEDEGKIKDGSQSWRFKFNTHSLPRRTNKNSFLNQRIKYYQHTIGSNQRNLHFRFFNSTLCEPFQLFPSHQPFHPSINFHEMGVVFRAREENFGIRFFKSSETKVEALVKGAEIAFLSLAGYLLRSLNRFCILRRVS